MTARTLVTVLLRDGPTGLPERGEQEELLNDPLLFVSCVVLRWDLGTGLWPADWVMTWRTGLRT